MQKQTITPFLWFNDQAEEAARFYTSVFKNSQMGTINRYGPEGPGPEGSVMVATFQLDGQEFIALNGGPQFQFTEAISFVVTCDTQDEIDKLWQKLSEGGKPVQCGWLKDRYGLSWQIVPTIFGELMQTSDAAKRGRVMQAMMQMTKLDIAQLKQAYEGIEAAVA